MPLLALLLFGILTGGLTVSRQNAVKNSVREATRFGAVNDRGTITTANDYLTYLRDVVNATELAASGDLDDGTPGKSICAAFIDDTDGFVASLTVDTNGSETFSTAAPCFVDGLSSVDRVQVTAERTSEISAIFFERTVELDARSVTRYER